MFTATVQDSMETKKIIWMVFQTGSMGHSFMAISIKTSSAEEGMSVYGLMYHSQFQRLI